MNFLFWLWTIDALDDLREQIRRNGLTPAQQADELARKKLRDENEKFITTIIWCIAAAIPFVAVLIAYFISFNPR